MSEGALQLSFPGLVKPTQIALRLGGIGVVVELFAFTCPPFNLPTSTHCTVLVDSIVQTVALFFRDHMKTLQGLGGTLKLAFSEFQIVVHYRRGDARPS